MPFPQPIALLAGGSLQDTWPETFGLVSSAEMVPQLPASKLQQHSLHIQSSQRALVYHLSLIFQHILQAGGNSGSVQTEQNSWEPFSKFMGLVMISNATAPFGIAQQSKIHTSIAQMIPVTGCH